jgi:hypothetical protein
LTVLGPAFFSMSIDTTAGATFATMSAKLIGAPSGVILAAAGAFTARSADDSSGDDWAFAAAQLPPAPTARSVATPAAAPEASSLFLIIDIAINHDSPGAGARKAGGHSSEGSTASAARADEHESRPVLAGPGAPSFIQPDDCRAMPRPNAA